VFDTEAFAEEPVAWTVVLNLLAADARRPALLDFREDISCGWDWRFGSAADGSLKPSEACREVSPPS
jgi:hypothetical protein